MGFVLGARNIALDEPIAIKILRPDAVADGQAVARFFREARASVRMKGEHVAKVVDVGSLAEGRTFTRRRVSTKRQKRTVSSTRAPE